MPLNGVQTDYDVSLVLSVDLIVTLRVDDHGGICSTSGQRCCLHTSETVLQIVVKKGPYQLRPSRTHGPYKDSPLKFM